MSEHICAIVLAAGEGLRMGKDKALLELGGKLAVELVAERCKASGIEVLVVRRNGARPLPEGLETVVVSEPAEMMDSLRAGIEALPRPCSGALIFPVDYAMVAAQTVREVRAGLEAGAGQVVLPLFEGRPGHPIGLSAALVPEILDPEVGSLRDVIRRDRDRVEVVAVSDPWVLRDLDTPEDLEAARASLQPPSSGQ